MFRHLSLKVYAHKDLVNRLWLWTCAGGSSCRALLDALRVKNKSISACLLEAQPVLTVYGRINQKCPGVALWINPARVSEPVPIREKPTWGAWVAVDGWWKNISPTFVTTSLLSLWCLRPNGGWSRTGLDYCDGLPHFTHSTRKEPGWMSRFKFDYIWITETCSKYLLPHTSCLSDSLPQIPKSLLECKLRLHSSDPVSSDCV